VFDSVYRPSEYELKHHNLLQHFKGWHLKVEKPIFDPEHPTMMNFQIAQHNECRFVYVLPFSETEALVEFTVFGPNLMEQSAYDDQLKDYLKNALQLTNYEIVAEEFGVIPMSDQPMTQNPAPHVIRIGTSGGYVKASSGYTFTRTQKYLQQLVQQLADKQVSVATLQVRKSSRFDFYDTVLLNIMQHNKYPSDKIFTRLFRYNPAASVFRFLDEDSHLLQDIRLMVTLPIFVFSKAALSVIFRRK
jgi:lycopene beta-cyclase